MFSSASFSSISFATVTPSLVIVGDPKFLPRMTLRPCGPSVTFTAFARLLTPRRIPCRDASPYIICFAIRVSPAALPSVRTTPIRLFLICRSAAVRTASTSSSRMMRYSSPSTVTSWLVYLPNRIKSPVLTSSGTRSPSSLILPLPAAITVPRCGFSLAVSGMMIPPILCSPSSRRRTMIRSWSGLISITFLFAFPGKRTAGNRDLQGMNRQLSEDSVAPISAARCAVQDSVKETMAVDCQLVRFVRKAIQFTGDP